MAHPLAARLEEIVQRSRSKRVSLAERLQVVADLVRTEAPEFCAEVNNFVGRLEAAKAGGSAPDVGEKMPDFTMPDQDGKLISLESLLETGAAVLVFHRGHWCPYCRISMAAPMS